VPFCVHATVCGNTSVRIPSQVPVAMMWSRKMFASASATTKWPPAPFLAMLMLTVELAYSSPVFLS